MTQQYSQTVEALLSGIYVHKLFSKYNYRINLAPSKKVTIITAPNGFGKSTLLQIINYFFEGNYAALALIPFERAELSFGDRLLVKIEPDKATMSVCVSLMRRVNETWKDILNGPWIYRGFKAEQREAGQNSRSLEFFWDRIATREQRALRAAGISARELELLAYINRAAHESKEPSEIAAVRRQECSRLISVQRLYVETWGEVDKKSDAKDAISEIARRVAAQVRAGRVSYGERSREQEKTFVERAINVLAKHSGEASNPSIGSLIEKIQYLEREYQRVALIEPGETPALRKRLGASQAEEVLVHTYLQDVAERLTSLSDVAGKLALFLDNANELFQHKSLQLSKDTGFKIFDKDGRDIPIDRLSSGEQHLLVLLGLLIFGTEAADLVLIDEPEISLHPAWQDRFLSLVENISQINGCRVVMATHSPLIINGQWDLVVELAEQVE